MDYMLLMGNESSKLVQRVYFMCKYKKVKADNSSCIKVRQQERLSSGHKSEGCQEDS
jgi:hypothetical protein